MNPTFLLSLVLASGAAAAPRSDGPSPLVLIVANNRSTQLGRPPLQYADDDGAKYWQVFASLAGEEHTALLTEFDRDTARLFPDLVARVRPPTRAELSAAGRRLAAQAAELRRAGRTATFYFVFAGHGDVDQGRGFLELADGPFTSDDLEALLRSVGAEESHVILDSCNSFFVVNSRKPGGRRFATPRDAAENLARRLPQVGVFLSTSAEAAVYEWSELQSGVFSHAVRSGLMGAADADHDGRVTYQELEAFVETAAAEIKNPLFRPKVYARGPNGEDRRTLFDLGGTRSVALRVDEPGAVRLAARDRDGLRWLDVYKERGAELELRIPRALASRLEIERLEPGSASVVQARYLLPEAPSASVALASLDSGAPAIAGRGAGDVFRALFTRPFGPKAMAAYEQEKAQAPEPVFGISREDAERMGLLLEQLGEAARQSRLGDAAKRFVVGAGWATYYGLASRDKALTHDARVGYLVGAGMLAGVGAGMGIYRLTQQTERERVLEHYRTAMAEPGADQARVAAEIEDELHRILEDERSTRKRQLIVNWIGAGIGAGLLVWNETARMPHDERILNRGVVVGVTAITLSQALSLHLTTSPTEKLIELWEKDPARDKPALSISPVPGGGMLSISGGF